jgi:hypothetical protein
MMNAAGFEAWLATTDPDKPLGSYMTVLQGTAIQMKKLEEKVESMQDDVNLWECMKQAGIDNAVAYEHGYQIYFEQYPEKDDILG